MALDHSRIAVGIFISLISLGAAYGTLGKSRNSVPAPDSTREMYADVNEAFVSHWKARTGVDIIVGEALSKSGNSVRLTFDGLDVAAQTLFYDAPKLREKGILTGLSVRKSLSYSTSHAVPQAVPYTSTIVFVVRKGNPRNIRDWNDLANADVEVVVPNPRVSAEGRWSYLAAWGHALKQGGDDAAAFKFVSTLFANARSPYLALWSPATATIAFAENGVGDVLLAWENEAHRLVHGSGAHRFEIITPSQSIAAEPVVSVVDATAGDRGARRVTAAYIDYLHGPEAQDIAGKHYFRPRDPSIRSRYENELPSLELFSVDEIFGSWRRAHALHFAQGGTLERIRSGLTTSGS